MRDSSLEHHVPWNTKRFDRLAVSRFSVDYVKRPRGGQEAQGPVEHDEVIGRRRTVHHALRIRGNVEVVHVQTAWYYNKHFGQLLPLWEISAVEHGSKDLPQNARSARYAGTGNLSNALEVGV